MCAVEVSLFDVSRQTLVPVENGCVIWVRTEIPAEPWEELSVSAGRPLVAFELLQRVLEYEGLSGRFVIESLSDDDCTLLKAFGELEPREMRRLHDDPGGRRFAAQGRRIDPRIEIVMPVGDRSECSDYEAPTNADTRRAKSNAGEEAAPADLTVGKVAREHGRPALLMHMLGTHYSQPLPELSTGLREASARIQRIGEVAALIDAHSPGPADMDEHMREFRKALGRDLDAPAALRAMFEWLREAELRPDRIGDSHLQEMLGLLDLDEVLEEQVPTRGS